MLHQRDDEEMMLDEFSSPNRSGAFVCKGLHSAMFTSKYRGETGAHEAVDSGQFQALTKLGGSQSSRGTTAAFRGKLIRSAASGDAMSPWHIKMSSVQDGEPHEDLPATEETHLTMKNF